MYNSLEDLISNTDLGQSLILGSHSFFDEIILNESLNNLYIRQR
jgi:hypothetical protein